MTTRQAPRRPAIRACSLAVIVVLGVAAATTAQAEDLMGVYRQALKSDPVLKQARAQKRIGKAGVGRSRAVLLPQINGRVSFNDSHGTVSSSQLVQTPAGSGFVDNFGHTAGRSRTESIGLNQVLFDLGEFAQLKASKANAASTAAQYRAAQQNLILRVARAYFTVLTDVDNLKFAKANVKALKKQLQQAQAKYHVGFAAITDVVDAKANYDTAIANAIAAKNALFNARQALTQITGQPVTGLDPLVDQLPLNPPTPDNMQAWVKTALANNPSLHAQQKLVAAANHDLTAARAARLPTLNASVNYTRNPSWGPNAIAAAGLPSNVTNVLRGNRRTTDTSIGLVLSVPLFAGGGIHAQISQAVAQRNQARDILEQDRRTTVSNTRSAYKAIKAGISSVQAQKAAVASAKTALDATRAGYQIGTQTIVALLIAQETYFNALSAYSQARHALVVNRLNLQFASGTLSVNDLQAVNALLQK